MPPSISPLSKSKTRLIRSLGQRKHRDATGLFVAEGPKVVGDLLSLARPTLVVATEQWAERGARLLAAGTELSVVSESELRGVSFLQHPQQVLGLFRRADMPGGSCELPGDEELCIALDGVQDPGNLGTIVRVADWFGITRIYCSPSTADVWNPKVVQATMGSVARVAVGYCDLPSLVDRLPAGYPVYGTLLDGDDIHHARLSGRGLLVMGNESCGLSAEMRERVTERLLIPPYPAGRSTADSLNVAIATAITVFALRGAATSL